MAYDAEYRHAYYEANKESGRTLQAPGEGAAHGEACGRADVGGEMKLYFVSDTGRADGTCTRATDVCALRAAMANAGFREVTMAEWVEQAKSMRNAERRDDAAREREELQFKRECRG